MLPIVTLVNLLLTSAVVADQWGANDDASDDPDNYHGWWAPHSAQHTMSRWGVDRRNNWDFEDLWHMDQVVDDHLQWEWNVQDQYRNNPGKNYVHEVRTGRYYEAISGWYSTNLPTPNHVEDEWEGEEIIWGEEMELGWLDPATKLPGSTQWGVGERHVYTGYGPAFCDPWAENIEFESEGELTQFGGVWPGNPWYPVAGHWDVLGYLAGCCRR